MSRTIFAALLGLALVGCGPIHVVMDRTPSPLPDWTVTGIEAGGEVLDLSYTLPGGGAGHWRITGGRSGFAGGLDERLANCAASARVGEALPDCARRLLP